MVNDIQQRFMMFLMGCIVVRIILVVLAATIPPTFLPIMGVFAVILVAGWLRIYLFAPRNTGPEVVGGKIWWNDLRPFHAAMWFWFAVLAFGKSQHAWVPLAVDVSVGLVGFLAYHGIEGNFAKL